MDLKPASSSKIEFSFYSWYFLVHLVRNGAKPSLGLMQRAVCRWACSSVNPCGWMMNFEWLTGKKISFLYQQNVDIDATLSFFFVLAPMSKAQTLYSISNEIKTMISKHELDMIIHPFVSPHLDDCSSLFHSSKQNRTVWCWTLLPGIWLAQTKEHTSPPC